MFDPYTVYATAAVIGLLVLSQVFRKVFDPFEPVWLFLVGYVQVYVIQALSYREYALRVRGPDLVAAANLRAFWALVFFLAVYYSGLGKRVARKLPRPPHALVGADDWVDQPVSDRVGALLRGFCVSDHGSADDGGGELAALAAVCDAAGGDLADRDRAAAGEVRSRRGRRSGWACRPCMS